MQPTHLETRQVPGRLRHSRRWPWPESCQQLLVGTEAGRRREKQRVHVEVWCARRADAGAPNTRRRAELAPEVSRKKGAPTRGMRTLAHQSVVCEVPTRFVISAYSNRVMVAVTQADNMGTLVRTATKTSLTPCWHR